MEKLVNFRDLGGMTGEKGKKVMPKRLLRASALCDMEKGDVQSLLDEYELRNIVDLRSIQELEEYPDDKLPGTTYIHLDVSGGIRGETPSMDDIVENLRKESAGKMMQEAYRNLVMDKGAKAAYAKYVHILLETPKGATLFHCAQGKDRTGFAAAISLKLLGVSDEDIMQDYLKTNEQRKAANEQIVADAAAKGAPPELQEGIRIAMGVDKSWLEEAYHVMGLEYGGFNGYLEKTLGVTSAMRKELQHLYLI